MDIARATLVALTVLLATACGTGNQTATDTEDQVATAASPTDAEVTPTQQASSAPAPAATATATPTQSTSTEAAPAEGDDGPLVAEPGGLRAVTLGEPLERAVAQMTARFGSPDADTGWEPAGNSSYGVCPGVSEGAQVRGIRWDRIRLLFSDGPTSYGSEGYQHVFAYDLTGFEGSGTAPATAQDIGLGSTVEELRSAYGDRLEVEPGEASFPDRFTVRFGRTGAISGSLSATDPDGEVTFIGAGLPCGE